jgi:ankyrin repeat protein
MEFYPPIDWARHPLHAAAFSANSGEVRRLIGDGADVNERLDLDVNGHQDTIGTPLHAALRNCPIDTHADRHLEVVSVLLGAGADIRSLRKWEGTPLHDAAQFGLVRVAELLISAGADVNSTEDVYRRTPLILAAAHGKLRMIECLFTIGARVDAIADWKSPSDTFPLKSFRYPRNRGRSALQVAAENGHVAVVKWLLNAGASPDRAAVDLATEAKQASNERFDEILALLRSCRPG